MSKRESREKKQRAELARAAQAEADERLRALVVGTGLTGIGMAALVAAMGMSDSALGYRLRLMAAAGLIERSNTGGQFCRWGAPGIWAANQAMRDKGTKEREASRRRRAAAKAAAAPERWARPPASVWAYAGAMA